MGKRKPVPYDGEISKERFLKLQNDLGNRASALLSLTYANVEIFQLPNVGYMNDPFVIRVRYYKTKSYLGSKKA